MEACNMHLQNTKYIFQKIYLNNDEQLDVNMLISSILRIQNIIEYYLNQH